MYSLRHKTRFFVFACAVCASLSVTTASQAVGSTDFANGAPAYDGVSIAWLDGYGEFFPFVLENINDADMEQKVRNTFAEYQRLGIDVVRVVIAPHWWAPIHWAQPGLCGTDCGGSSDCWRPNFLTFREIYPTVDDYDNGSTSELDAVIGQLVRFADLAGEYQLSISVNFSPPQICPGFQGEYGTLCSTNPATVCDFADDLERAELWIGRWIEAFDGHAQPVLVNLLSEIILHDPAVYSGTRQVLHPDAAFYRTDGPYVYMYPNVPQSSLAENHGRWAVELWNWFHQAYPDTPASFEMLTRALWLEDGYSGWIVRRYADWIYQNMPDLSAASLEFYIGGPRFDFTGFDTNKFYEAGREMTDAYFDSYLFHNTGMPLWIDEYGFATCWSDSSTEEHQTDHVGGILAATEPQEGRPVLGRILWHGGYDPDLSGAPCFGIFEGFDTSVYPAGVPVVKSNYEGLFMQYFRPPTDSDGDGLVDVNDNCVLLANYDQADADGDGIGTACDADFNNDCAVNAVDLGVFKQFFFSANTETDLNGDGVTNVVDLGILKTLYFQPPGPRGVSNICN